MNPKVTVLMSVYNSEMFLREAIESVLNQTYQDFEFLIINDGSTDSSKEIILSFNNPKIKLIDKKENIGLTRSLNKGLRLANGEYLARHDADDISLPRRLEKQVEYLEKNPPVVLLGTWAEDIDRNGKKIHILKYPIEHCLILWRLLFNNCIVHSSVMFHREKALKLGSYENITYGQDYDLWIRLSRAGKIGQLPEILLKRRISGESISSKYSDEQRRTRARVAFDYAGSIVPDLDYDNFIHFMNKTENHNLTWRQIKEIVSLTGKVKSNFLETNKPDSLCRKEIDKDIRDWFWEWAKADRGRPLICLYLFLSGLSHHR